MAVVDAALLRVESARVADEVLGAHLTPTEDVFAPEDRMYDAPSCAGKGLSVEQVAQIAEEEGGEWQGVVKGETAAARASTDSSGTSFEDIFSQMKASIGANGNGLVRLGAWPRGWVYPGPE